MYHTLILFCFMTTFCQISPTPAIIGCNEEFFVSSYPLHSFLFLAAFLLLLHSGRLCSGALRLLTDFISLMETFLRLRLSFGCCQISLILPGCSFSSGLLTWSCCGQCCPCECVSGWQSVEIQPWTHPL